VQRTYNVLSPHLDDAALSCSLFLAANPGSAITTVFASGPASVSPLTPWDRAARYFPEGADVMGVRSGEDISGAALVGATAEHLDYWDRQYRNPRYEYRGPEDEELLSAIVEELLSRAARDPGRPWVIPLGLGHPDHRMTADAGLALAERMPGEVFVYEELPYALEDEQDVRGRKERLAGRGLALRPDDSLRPAGDRALKSAVIRCHASQRRSLRRRARSAARAAERVWALVPG